MNRLGKNIIDACGRKNMSVDDLQRATGLDRSVLYRYVKCKSNPTLKSMLLISRALEISLDELAEGVEP